MVNFFISKRAYNINYFEGFKTIDIFQMKFSNRVLCDMNSRAELRGACCIASCPCVHFAQYVKRVFLTLICKLFIIRNKLYIHNFCPVGFCNIFDASCLVSLPLYHSVSLSDKRLKPINFTFGKSSLLSFHFITLPFPCCCSVISLIFIGFF